MLTNNLPKNINRIDYDLKKLFSKVNISEKSKIDKFYIEIISEGQFILEKNKISNATSKVLIEKKYLEGDIITWKYSINPDKKNADYIERTSSIDTIAKEIYETISKKQIDSKYIDSVLNESKLIKESLDFDFKPELTSEELILKVLEKNNVKLLSIESKIDETKIYEFGKNNYNIFATHEGLKVSQKFSLEEDLNQFSFINFVNFKDNQIIVNYK